MGQTLEQDDIGYAFKVKFFTLISDFILPQWNELKDRAQKNLTLYLDSLDITIPELIGKDVFVNIIQSVIAEHETEKLETLFLKYKLEGEHMHVDQFYYVLITYNLVNMNETFTGESVAS